MKIINNNAIAALYEKVEDLNQQSTEGWKCIYFKIPGDSERQEHGLARFDENVVAHLVSRMNGFAFFCDTNEIFILYRGNYNSLTTRLSIYLWSLCAGNKNLPVSHQLFSFFELTGQWKSFYSFCEKRYMESLAASEEKRMFQHFETPIPAELVFNEHVAGYLNSK